MKLKTITYHYPDCQFIQADGLEGALIGVEDSNPDKPRLVYSVRKCLKIFMTQGMEDWNEAREYFDFNTKGAYVGEQTPIWVEDDLD
jgi:hypothetical protein